jgi:hypothetical protein
MDGYCGLGVLDSFEMFFSALGTDKRKRTVAKIYVGFHIAPRLV